MKELRTWLRPTRLLSLAFLAVAASTLGACSTHCPDKPGTKATGYVIRVGNSPVNAEPEYGELEIKYLRNSDASHPTTWQRRRGGPWSLPPLAVKGYQTNSGYPLRRGPYDLRFARTTVTPADRPPPPTSVTIQPGQRYTLKIRYD